MSDSSSARPASARWIDNEHGVYDLARWVVDPERAVPIVCVTAQPRAERPLLDPDGLARAVGDAADVWAVPIARHQWMLTEELPKGLDVYGGAARVWWPMENPRKAAPRDHPTFAVFSPEDAVRATDDIVAHVTQPRGGEPSPGDDVTGVVTAVHPNGADVRLSSGHLAFVANAHMAENAEIYHAREVVQEGQEVKLRVSDDAYESGRDRLRVSMRPFAPNPWTRVMTAYRKGAVVEGIVLRLTPFGAFVELLPGAEGLIHKSQISDDFVDHIPDYLRENDRIAVRINDVNRQEGRAELTLRGISPDEPVMPVASLYEDGPPWLPVDDVVDGSAGEVSDESGAPGRGFDADGQRDGLSPNELALREELDAAYARISELERLLDERY
ncbi:MAG: S1 RNA-binding domain-containing protein [Solirubrobacteraceae bacterium]|nr:S1 RNA-binding domain-containing protein [Solirubrobacteraceae bacterium]